MKNLNFLKPNQKKVAIFLVLSALVLLLPLFLSWYSELFCIRDMMLGNCMTPKLDISSFYGAAVIVPLILIAYLLVCAMDYVFSKKVRKK